MAIVAKRFNFHIADKCSAFICALETHSRKWLSLVHPTKREIAATQLETRDWVRFKELSSHHHVLGQPLQDCMVNWAHPMQSSRTRCTHY